MRCELKKAKVLLTATLSPCLNSGVHIFIQCLWFNESDHLGGRFCLHRQSLVLCRIDWGHRDHKEQTSDEHGDNKGPSHSYPICGNTEKKQWRMSPITASSWIIRNIQLQVTQSHLWISQMRLSRCLSLSVSLSLSFSCIKQKGIKQLQTKVSAQLGILSSHKVLLQRLTLTFTGSENRARGIQRLFKWQTLYGAFTKDLVE